MIGQTISHYKILEKLGEGGMGVVYKAKDTKLNRIVALKFLPHHITTGEVEQARFLQEAQTAAVLNHPNICTIYAIEEAEEQQFIVMEYVDGHTIRNLKTENLKFATVLTYAIQIAEALQEAHSKEITHRDIKPDNVMINSKNQIKVMDFGLAKLKGALKLTRTSSTAGTLAYMAPEQIQGGKVDGRTDIFAFGVVLFEILTRKLPFRGEHEAAMMYSIVNEGPIAIESLQPNVPSACASIILRCLEKDKEKRYQSFAEIVAELRNVQQHISGYAPTELSAVSRYSKAIWVSAAAIGVLILGVLLYQFVFNLPAKSTSLSPTIAVLYLENMTEDTKFDSFSAGMTEEIINELSNVPGVQVVSRNEVRQFRDKAVDVREIGEKLGVSYVLEGSVRVEGKRLRITCQAIQTHDRFHFWSQGYTRELKSAFDVQSDIAQQVALALKIKFAQKNLEQNLGLPANSLLKQ